MTKGRKYNYGEVSLRLLEAIAEGLQDTADVFRVILTAGYGASVRKLDNEFRKIQQERDDRRAKQEAERTIQKRYVALLYKLKKDGLVVEKKSEKRRFLFLTHAGIKKLNLLKNTRKNKLPTPRYDKEESGRVTIIIFDVPEAERKKRAWLRSALASLGFTLVQKSVWIGKSKIPKEFLNDLKNLNLIPCVEIFEITRAGSLKQLT
ncbi:CRISPR-associated endonuclease Cas2 [Candidatus Wolfebacteria bacterium]|nr:CRISPR-associated endonuclease Cas2 [Candidatus Wolfebacteria bacterium]